MKADSRWREASEDCLAGRQCSIKHHRCPQDPSKISETPAPPVSSTGEEKQSKSQQLRKIFQEYGAVGVSLHIGISLISLGIFYMVVSSGVDMSAILLKLGFKESLVQSKMAAGTSTFVVAYAIHKLFAPVRISITLVSVPFIVRYFRKVGFFKPPAAKP
ncbi:protein FAM210B, mitochondrial isoform X2 [Zalophus californianus]|uniref:Protein FAM210B, mitochondrial isoform X2 n=1 Tax=Zalophus californianus TaxID=9704 RepID=A0A6J2FCL8_ZALCA|nr:protein FAM210B, mitochondrial isoform X2 [Zalophus californianus]